MVAAHLRDQRLTGPRPAIAAEPGPPPEGPIWIATQPKQELELAWDPRAEPVSNATAGVLRIEDTGGPRQMSLDVGELLLGGIMYAPASERIRVELTTLQRDGRMVPVAVSARSAPPSFEAPVAENLPPVAEKKPEMPTVTKADPPAKAEAPAPQPVPARRPPLKRFTWNAADRSVAAPALALDAPHPVLPSAQLPAFDLGVPAAPAPPPRPAPAPAAIRTLPRSGRLIWTGTLQRRGVVELDGRAASVGTISGGLPGAPVNVSVTPAEFTEDGLVVFTTEASRHNRVEPASAGNGWNKTTFVWAPERVREIAILEGPNAANGFNRLTLRSDARRCSMILIDWTLR
jgi:hypothetical protein